MPETTVPILHAEQTALFLDFDGTLVDIQDNPDTIFLREDQTRILTDLSGKLNGALAIVSGRDVRDISKRVPASLWRVGSHGLESLEPNEKPRPQSAPAPTALTSAIAALEEPIHGIRMESKGEVLAIHYRNAPHRGEQLFRQITEIVAGFPDYKVQHGKMVIEAKPNRANKGYVLKTLLHYPPFEGRKPVMVGDDATDEDAINAALSVEGSAVKVGPGESTAPYRLESPAQVWDWLERSTHELA
jgi:trehalose 6-phosphate phosphatase